MTDKLQPDLSNVAEIRLPNGVTLRRGSRVRVPKDLIWHPDVVANAESLGWKLDNDGYSYGSEVLIWPASDDEEAQ